MNIVCLVQLTYPDDIVKAMFTENGVTKPFPTIYCGPAGFNCHLNSCHQYEDNLIEEPGLMASSLQLLSCSGKQPTKKQTMTAWEKASIGPSKGMQFPCFILLVLN